MCMKKAALYARVSSDLQRKEKTIESQLAELKKQISASGDVLVKEYVDDGHSGAMLDRPAMNQLRADLKTPLFDTIYFLNTDRIAREVTYQTIIIAEILKYRKQIIINGKDYIHNPENKFTLTVLGAVAELERAKIIERTVRARQHRLVQGKLLGCGNNIYGYDYHKRTPTSDPYYTVKESEAKVVRFVFDTYAKGQVGMNQINRRLEDMKAPTKRGRGIWRTSLLKVMLKNEMYTGIRYFNTMRSVREYANPMHGVEHSTKKVVRRDRGDWVGIPVPTIISKELFAKVQERIEYNRKKYRNPKTPQLLSNLIRCGECKGSFFAYRRYYVDRRQKDKKLYYLASYKCNWRQRHLMHSENTDLRRCHNKEIKCEILEAQIMQMVQDVMLNETELRQRMSMLAQGKKSVHLRIEGRLKKTDKQIDVATEAKKRVLNLYASGELEKEEYVKRSFDYDNELNRLNGEREELLKQIPLLHKKEVVDVGIKQYAESARVRFEQCHDFENMRRFFLDYVEKIVFTNDKVQLHGSVPVKLKAYDDRDQPTQLAKIEFCIKGEIPREATRGRKDRKPDFKILLSREKYNAPDHQFSGKK